MGKLGEKAEGLGNTLKGAFKDAAAANDAHRANEAMKEAQDAANGKVHGGLYNAVENATDLIADTANLATLGLSRRLGNVFDDKDSKIDYKELKAEKKAGNITSETSKSDRARILINDNLSQLQGTGTEVSGPEI